MRNALPSELQKSIYVTLNQLEKLEQLLASRAHTAALCTKDVDLETSESPFVLELEKPGRWPRGKLLDLRAQLREGRLYLTGLRRTNHQTKEQYFTQFPGCYLVACDPRRGRFNFVPLA